MADYWQRFRQQNPWFSFWAEFSQQLNLERFLMLDHR